MPSPDCRCDAVRRPRREYCETGVLTVLDVAIRGGQLDGTRAPRRVAGLGIVQGRVVEIGKVHRSMRQMIEFDGSSSSEGFVDLHKHFYVNTGHRLPSIAATGCSKISMPHESAPVLFRSTISRICRLSLQRRHHGIFASRLYFSCKAGDPMIGFACEEDKLLRGIRMNATLVSVIGRWGVAGRVPIALRGLGTCRRRPC